MHADEYVISAGWAAFWLYWLVAAFSRKRQHERIAWASEIRIRVVLAILVVVLIRLGAFRNPSTNSDPWRAAIGLTIFAAGLGFAVWARVHIGRNWGSPMSRKKDPELIKSGPYRMVRHPIYSGILLAGAGSGVALSWSLLIAVALAGIYFIYSAVAEERHMAQAFPETYPAYRRSSKMLVPFVL